MNYGVIGSSISAECTYGKSITENNTFIQNKGYSWFGNKLGMGTCFSSISSKNYTAFFKSNKIINNWSEYWGSITIYQTYIVMIDSFFYGEFFIISLI